MIADFALTPGAAKRLGMQAVGFDVDEAAVRTARARLAEAEGAAA